MNRRFLIMTLLFAFIPVLPAVAQSNAILDDILAKPTLRFQDLAYLSLTSSGVDTDSPESAAAQVSGMIKEYAKYPPDSIVNLGDFCYVMMQAHKLPGGLWYTLFPGTRYALREFVFLGILKNPVWISKKLSGEQAMRTLGNILEWKEAHP